MRLAAITHVSLWLLAAAGVSAAPPAPKTAIQPGQCHFSSMVKDSDPAGTNVRSGPGLGFPIIGKVPHMHSGKFGIEGDTVDFWVVELRDGWARITDAWQYSENHPDQRLASGWIANNFLLFDIQSDYVFERPDPKSRIVATTWFDKDGGHPPQGRRPFACQSDWVHLMVTGHDKVERPAWARGICGNADTSCDGLPYDGPANRDNLPNY